MNKSEWEAVYKDLDIGYADLYMHERDYVNGSNKKIREKGGRDMDYIIDRIKNKIRRIPELYEMAIGGENISDYSRAIIADEFFSRRYIVRDLSRLLGLIQEKIKSFPNEE